MKKIYSAIRPTGKLHIGNYLGAIKNWVELQKNYDCVFGIADYHAITTPYDAKKFSPQLQDTILDLLACGLDPKKSILMIQSLVPEHLELEWILSTLTPLSYLERIPTFKEKIDLHPEYKNLGLFSYPVLMASDILIYKSDFVPVGEDQLPHIELTRYLAKKFNQNFGKIFPLPQALLTETPRIMSLSDPTKKMSKTGADGISLTDTPEIIWGKLSVAVTDPARKRKTDKGNPKKCNLFELHKFFSSEKEREKIKKACQNAKWGCLDCKKILAYNINRELEPIRLRRKELEKNIEKVKNIFIEGAERAKLIAQKTLKEVKEKIGLI